jgi:Flp pilus assembly protein TadB
MTAPARQRPSGVPEFQAPELRNAGSSRRRLLRRAQAVVRDPEAVALTADLVAMAVAAGLTPYLAVEMAARFGPPAVAGPLRAVLSAVEGGLRFGDALDTEAVRSPELAPLLATLANSERSGAPVGPALGRLAASTRAQARRRAMARARTVPVRLLFPLVFLVLPAFLLLTVAPVVLASLAE